MKLILSSIILSLLTHLSLPAYSIDNRDIYLVRHAEKQADGTKDPSLTRTGQLRANNISKMLQDKNISAIYSSDYKRTRETAMPLAKLLGIQVKLYDARKLAGFAEEVLKAQGNLLIVGHSNTTPDLATLLGGNSFGEIDESEYDRVYQLNYLSGKVKSQLLYSQPQ